MKKILTLLLCSAMLLFAGCTGQQDNAPEEDAATPAPPPGETITVGTACNAAIVNIRIEPDGESRIVDNAMRGDMYQVLDYREGAETEWYKIICMGDTAYISADYLFITQWESGTELTLGTVVNSDEVVGIYSSADSESPVVLGALKGEQYLVIYDDSENGWYKLGFPEGEGYISSDYLEVKTVTIENALS